MYLIINIDLIHHLYNEPKKSIVSYNKNRMEYFGQSLKAHVKKFGIKIIIKSRTFNFL